MLPTAARFQQSVTTARRNPEGPEWQQRLQYIESLNRSQPGLLLGRYRNIRRGGEPVYIYDYTDGFVAIYYPTRGGKGISFIIPNALMWTHSLFMSDPKVENIKLTGSHRRYNMSNMVFCLSPASRAPYVSRYNFLDEIRVGTFYEISDAYNVATAIVDPDGKGFADPKEAVWKRRSRDLLSAGILHVIYCDDFKEKSLATVIGYFTDASEPFAKKLERMMTYPHDKDGRFGWKNVKGELVRTHPYISAKINEQKERTDQEAASVRGEAQSYLSYYQNPTVRENGATSDFSMRDLTDNLFPATLSLGITPEELEAAQPFLRLFLNMFINRNLTEIAPDPVTMKMLPAHRWVTGMPLDEFAIFGRLDLFVKQLSFLAGFRFKPAIVCQDLQQVRAEYSTLENLTSNVNTVLFGKMNNQDSAEYFSKSMGPMTMGFTDSSTSVSAGTNSSVSYSTNYKKDERPFFRPEELRRFSNAHSMMIRAGGQPVILEKLKYFEKSSGYAHMISDFRDEVSDSIPYEDQIAHVNLRELQGEYLDWCQRNGEGITARNEQLDRQAAEVTEIISKKRDAYLEQAHKDNRFAIGHAAA